MRGKKYSDEIKEKAYLLYATCGSYKEVSNALKAEGIDVAPNTICGWIKDKPSDELDELRREKTKELIEGFSDKAAGIIELALERLEAELTDTEKNIPINHLTTAIGTLYDKCALARGESTENTKITFDLPESVGEYAD